ncbi:uncharacterized protein LOC113495413 isoform X2 [Trichoplusia ni]|nr:uncharacterized protein LOC113495413 isoform X2 [Trichoplusia ni]
MGKDECSLFHCTEKEKAEIRKEVGVTEAAINDGVDAIFEWFNKQPHLAEAGLTRVHAEMMIIISKGSIERAKEKIDNLYKYRALMPEILQTRKELLCSPEKIWDTYTALPMQKLYENRRIFFLFIKDSTDLNNLELYRRTLMLIDLRMKYDYMRGDIWILDLSNVSLMQVMTQNLMIYKKIALFFMKGLNWRIHAVHCINNSAPVGLVQRLIDFVGSFISPLILSRIIIHDSIEDLYKHVPKDCLPENYGGKEPHTDILRERMENEMRRPEITKYLMDCTKMVSNESLRPRDDHSEEYLSGSFKKLEFD